MSDVNPLVAGFFISAILANGLFWLMKARVASTGIPVKYYSPELRRILRFYKELAPGKGWSLWSITVFWISAAATVAFALGISRSGNPIR